jgi:alpha-galactosidase
MTHPTKVSEQLLHLRHGGVSVLLDTSGLPRILHWGHDLGDVDDLAAVAFALTPQVVSSVLDDLVPVSVLPSNRWAGWGLRTSQVTDRAGLPRHCSP